MSAVRIVTAEDWRALRAQFVRVTAESAQLRTDALRARSDAVEERVRSEDERHGRTDWSECAREDSNPRPTA